MMNNQDSYYGRSDQNTFEERAPDIKRYISIFISNWYWFAASLFISISISYSLNRYSERIYSVSASMLLKEQQFSGGLAGIDKITQGGDLLKSQQNLQNEIGILKSYTLNIRTIEELSDFQVTYVALGRRGIAETKVYKKCPFIVLSDSLDFQPIGRNIYIEINSDTSYSIEINGDKDIKKNMAFNEKFVYKGFNFRLAPRNPEGKIYNPFASNKYYFYFINAASLANYYRGKLSINPIDDQATLVTLTINGFVAEQEADYLNKIMDLYEKMGLENKNKIADSTISFIDKQLAIISDSLTRAENNLQNFRLQNSFIDISSEGNIIQNRLEKFENEKATFGLQKKYYLYLIEYINSKYESGDIVYPSVIGINDLALNKLVGELAGLFDQKKQVSMNLIGEIPALNLIDDKISISKRVLLDNVRNSLENINLSISDINERIKNVELELRKIPDIERQLIRIQRRFDLNNTIYIYLLEKQAETGITKASNISDSQIIDRAYASNSFVLKPKSNRNNMFAILLGMLFPGVLIILIDYFNNKIIDKKDIIAGTNAPILGYISHNDYRSELPVSTKPGSTLSESFRSVRTALKYFTTENQHPVVSITSTISAEGKTFVSVNLAAITALLGKRVLLIGLDLRKPRIHGILNVNNEVGMSSFLSENATYEQVIKETSIKNLFYAPSGAVPPNPAELIESARMDEFIQKAKEEFNYVIIDTPPVAVVTDALLLYSLADVNIFVVRQRYSSKNTLELIQDLYDGKKLKNLSIVLNDISLTGYYGYGLRYGYTMRYGGYSYGYNLYGEYGYGKYGYGKDSENYYTDNDNSV